MSGANEVVWVHDEFSDAWYPLDAFTPEELETLPENFDDVAFA